MKQENKWLDNAKKINIDKFIDNYYGGNMIDWIKRKEELIKIYNINGYHGKFADKIISQEKEMIRNIFQELWHEVYGKTFHPEYISCDDFKDDINKLLKQMKIEKINGNNS